MFTRLRRWFGLRCALNCCPCSTHWFNTEPPEQWAQCVDCGEKRVHLSTYVSNKL